MRTPLLSACMLALCAASVAAPARAADATPIPPYLDDRSDPAALIRSFYNAVNRKEFSRAWSYFGDSRPAKDYPGFVKGFDGTDHVTVITGDAGEEGAAGSAFYTVPVAIDATSADGTQKVFAGCYTLRLANPQIQEPPFSGLHIEKAQLKPAQPPLEDKLPASCGDAPPAPARDKGVEQAKKLFALAHAADCTAIRPDGSVDEPETHRITYKANTGEENPPDLAVRLMRFHCDSGAYNEMSVYYLETDQGGVQELQFAAPELDIRYENNDSNGKVESVTVIGLRTDTQLVNSEYDEATLSITSFSKWRGVGDASASGVWQFHDGGFMLVKYDVDASYDGKVDPETVIDYSTPP